MDEEYEAITKTLPHSMRRSDGLICPTLEEAVVYINAMDFHLIQEKLVSGDRLLCRKWSEVEAEIAIQYYRNFLFLNKKYLSDYPVLPPMLEVDEVWHQHILDTHQYEADCHRIFGYYFHHYPYFGVRDDQDFSRLEVAFEVIQHLHELEFGERMVSIWEMH